MDYQDTRKVRETARYDVAVAGGGIAGIAAAVAAARQGAKTVLLEKGILFGGLATVGLITWYEPLCDGNGKKMMGGMAEELILLAVKYGIDTLPAAWKNGGDTSSCGRFASHYSPAAFMMAIDELLEKAGVDIRLDTLAVYPVMEGRHCCGVMSETKAGRLFVPAKVVIDCTGDADVFHRAGAPTADGLNYMTYVAQGTNYEFVQKYIETKNVFDMRKWIGVGSNLEGEGHPEGVRRMSGMEDNEVTEFVLTGRKMLFEKIRGEDKRLREIFELPGVPQFRTTRHIAGAYDFDGSEEGKKFENAIGSFGDFRAKGRHFQLPYPALYCEGYDNLLAAGRMVSASGDGWELTRVIPVCALTGEAAGVAAAFAARDGASVSDVDVALLQKQLRDNGVLFE